MTQSRGWEKLLNEIYESSRKSVARLFMEKNVFPGRASTSPKSDSYKVQIIVVNEALTQTTFVIKQQTTAVFIYDFSPTSMLSIFFFHE